MVSLQYSSWFLVVVFHILTSYDTSIGQGHGASICDDTPIGQGQRASVCDDTPIGQGHGASICDDTPIGQGQRASVCDDTPIGQGHGANVYDTPIGQGQRASVCDDTPIGQGQRVSACDDTPVGQGQRASACDDTSIGQGQRASVCDDTPIGQGQRASVCDDTPIGQGHRASVCDDTPIGQGHRASVCDDTPIGQGHRASVCDDTPVGQGRKASVCDDTPIGQGQMVKLTDSTSTDNRAAPDSCSGLAGPEDRSLGSPFSSFASWEPADSNSLSFHFSQDSHGNQQTQTAYPFTLVRTAMGTSRLKQLILSLQSGQSWEPADSDSLSFHFSQGSHGNQQTQTAYPFTSVRAVMGTSRLRQLILSLQSGQSWEPADSDSLSFHFSQGSHGNQQTQTAYPFTSVRAVMGTSRLRQLILSLQSGQSWEPADSDSLSFHFSQDSQKSCFAFICCFA